VLPLPRGAGEAWRQLAAEAEGLEAGLEDADIGGGASEIVVEAGEADAFVERRVRRLDRRIGDGHDLAIVR